MTQVEDKPPIEEVMAHYGVMGMQWGKHSRAQATATQIRTARATVGQNRAKYKNQKAVADAMEKGSAAQSKAKLELIETKATMLKNPDRVIAARMTKGEKAASILLLPYGMTVMAGTSVRSRRIEYKQKRSMY
jgi:hypothetical protein